MEVVWERKSLAMRRNQEFPFGPVKSKWSLNGDLGTIKIGIGCFSSEFNREIKLKQLIWKSLWGYPWTVTWNKEGCDFWLWERKTKWRGHLFAWDMLPWMMEAGKILKAACPVGSPREGIHWSPPGTVTCDIVLLPKWWSPNVFIDTLMWGIVKLAVMSMARAKQGKEVTPTWGSR